jgi:hypothetical protein
MTAPITSRNLGEVFMLGSQRSNYSSGVFVSFLLAIVSGCHTTHVHDSTPPAPAHRIETAPVVVRKYVYVHYPSCNVYCDHERNLWFWFEAGEWRFGVTLPARYHVAGTEAVTIELERDKPYEHANDEHVVVDHSPNGHAYGRHHAFTYVRYPTWNVYCDRERKLWFWNEGGVWKSGAKLPAHYVVDEHEAVHVELESETPYEHGNAHLRQDGANGHTDDPHSNAHLKSSGNGGEAGTVANHGRDDDGASPTDERSEPNGRGSSKSAKDGASGDDWRNVHGKPKSGDASKPSSDGANGDHDKGSNGNGKSRAPSDDAFTKTNAAAKDDGDKSSNGKDKSTRSNAKESSEPDKSSGHGHGASNAKSPSKADSKATSNGKDKDAGSNGGKDKTGNGDPSSGSKNDAANGSSDDPSSEKSDAANGAGTGKGKGKDKKDKGKPDNG